MPAENSAESYIDRCISATNLYVEMYNNNMRWEITGGIALPLGKEFKENRFKSMTGRKWLENYEGVIRWNKIKGVGEDIDQKGLVSKADQVRAANASEAGKWQRVRYLVRIRHDG